jgi:calcium-dependent protein kinase
MGNAAAADTRQVHARKSCKSAAHDYFIAMRLKRSSQVQEDPNSALRQLRDVVDRLAQQPGEHMLRNRYHRGYGKLELNYQLTTNVLGVGINGGVRLATSNSNASEPSKRYAVKTFNLRKNTQTVACQAAARLVRWVRDMVLELEIMLTVDHPHIIRLFDVYETPTELHFVMECADGGEMFDRLVERERFEEGDAAEAARQMFSVVAYLHSQGIVHRDLKPENFLYSTAGGNHLKLTDFGFSRHWDGKSPMSEQTGTLAYSAPEVIKQSYGSAVDVWSLGIITFMLLSGYAPFEGDRMHQKEEILRGAYKWRPTYWKDVSSDGIAFVKSLLCVDSNARLTAKAALQHPWITSRAQAPVLPNLHLNGILQGLCRFQSASKLRRACLLTLARSMSDADIGDEVRSVFLQFDSSQKGMIDVKSLAQAIGNEEGPDNEETKEALMGLDIEEWMSYSHFLAASVPSIIKPDRALLLDAFRHFDNEPEGNVRQYKQMSFQDFADLVNGTGSVAEECSDDLGSSETASLPGTPTRPLKKGQLAWGRMRQCWAAFTGHSSEEDLASSMVSMHNENGATMRPLTSAPINVAPC